MLLICCNRSHTGQMGRFPHSDPLYSSV